MSWYLTYRVGGPIDRDTLRDLFEVAASQGMDVAATDVPARDTMERPEGLEGDVSHLMLPDGTLGFVSPEHDDPSVEALEDLCVRIGIPFVSKYDPDEEAGGSTTWWTPGMDGTSSSDSDHDGAVLVPLSEIAAAHAAGTIDGLLREKTIPELRPVSIVD